MTTLVVTSTQPQPATAKRLRAMAFATNFVRVPIGLAVPGCVLLGQSTLGASLLSLFVALDVTDGIAARIAGSDDAQRRGLDSIVDRSIITASFLAAGFQFRDFIPAAILIVFCNLLALPFALTSWRRYSLVLKAPKSHYCWSLTLFGAGLSYFCGQMGIAVTLSLLGACLMAFCSFRLVQAHTRVESDIRIGSVG